MSATKTKSPDQARSKILRLSFDDRMAFNRLIREGYKGRVLINWLSAHGVPGVNGENLRKYRRSPGYRAWLDEEQAVLADCARAENAMRLANALGGSASDKLKSILAGKLYGLLDEVGDPEKAQGLVAAVRAVTQAERLDLQRRQVDQRDEVIALERDKFELKTCELFIQWFASAKAREIVESTATNADKIAALRGEFFRDVDEMEKSGAVKLPT